MERNAVWGNSAESPTGVHSVAGGSQTLIYSVFVFIKQISKSHIWRDVYSPQKCFITEYTFDYWQFMAFYLMKNNTEHLLCCFINWNLTFIKSVICSNAAVGPTKAKSGAFAISCVWVKTTHTNSQPLLEKIFHLQPKVPCNQGPWKLHAPHTGSLLANQYSAVPPALLVVYTDGLSLH